MVDLGGFATQPESRAAALAVLDHLWDNREQRIGRLIVIDEAHNLCTPDPVDAGREAAHRAASCRSRRRVASTGSGCCCRRSDPRRCTSNALSQCDNLALMRMSSPRDLAELAEVFGYAPESLLERSTGLLCRGRRCSRADFVDQPSLVQMGARTDARGRQGRGSATAVPLR